MSEGNRHQSDKPLVILRQQNQFLYNRSGIPAVKRGSKKSHYPTQEHASKGLLCKYCTTIHELTRNIFKKMRAETLVQLFPQTMKYLVGTYQYKDGLFCQNEYELSVLSLAVTLWYYKCLIHHIFFQYWEAEVTS